ncbi:MAG: MoaD/ThiS family protein [Planctomycetota bacterium]|jgi:molybdopterin converting factor small subunit
MKVRVELTYDMAKVAGIGSFSMENAGTVREVISEAERRVGSEFANHARVCAVAVNGVLMNYKRGLKTRLADGDIVSFLTAAAGG